MKPRFTSLIILAGVAVMVGQASIGLVAWQLFSHDVCRLNKPAQGPRFVQNVAPPQMPIPVFQFGQAFQVEAPQAAEGITFTKEELKQLRGEGFGSLTLSGPFEHANLTVYLVHGQNQTKVPKFVSLQETLPQNLAVVHGGRAIDNRGQAPIFVQAGDILKGGYQDQVVPYDEIIPVGSVQTPVSGFCVEQGRSSPRAGEPSNVFQSSTDHVPTKSLKLAIARCSQVEIWNNVRNVQTNLTWNLGQSVHSTLSPTSLQLSLENSNTRGAVQNYLDSLAYISEGKEDVVGCVVVINGQIQSADVYASNQLFQICYPKLLKASAIGALAERSNGTTISALNNEAVLSFLTEAEQAPAFKSQRNGTISLRQESDRVILRDTCCLGESGVLHRNLLVK